MPEDLEAIIRMYTDMMFGMLIDWINNGMEGDYSRKLDIALTVLMPVLRANCPHAKPQPPTGKPHTKTARPGIRRGGLFMKKRPTSQEVRALR